MKWGYTMDAVDIKLLKDELKAQLNAYRFNKTSEDILKYFKEADVNKQHSLNSTIDFDSIFAAKNEWETCVDSLEYQAIIILDDNLNVIRANRTIEFWGWGDVNKIAGTHILNLIKPAIDNDSLNDWVGEWCQIDIQSNAEWESNDLINGKKFRFSFYPNRDIDSLHHDVDFYAVLLISDISDRREVEKHDHSELLKDIIPSSVSKNDSAEDLEHIEFKQKSEQHLHQLAEQLINSQEYERKRVSSELHDGVGQILSALKYQVESVVMDSQSTTRQRKNDLVLNNVLDNIKVALSELRRISVDLRPSILDDLGLLMTLRWFTGEFNKVYTDLNVELHIDASEQDISEKNKNTVYRIVQEAMNNAAKYAHAKNIYLQLTKSEVGLLLRIADDGCGFDVDQVKARKDVGLGIRNMEERALDTGAEFSLNSSSFLGTTITVFWQAD